MISTLSKQGGRRAQMGNTSPVFVGRLLSIGATSVATYAKNDNLYYLFDSELSLMLGQMALPSWNTGGRPSSPRSFAIGYNTETGKIELYTGSSWVGVTLS